MRKNKYGGVNDLKGWASNSGNYDKLKKNIYDTWFRMLERVHSPDYHAKQPTYIGCSIEPSWYFLSNFVRDFRNLPGFRDYELAKGIGYALDKDTLHPGNKHYGPQYCIIITVSQNCSESAKRTKARPVLQFDLVGNFIAEFRTPSDADALGFYHSNIIKCCNGEYKQHKGYVWKWK